MKDKQSPVHELIETPSDLENFARSLRRRRVIAVDMEADSMYHYKEKVCLLQIATREQNVIIDPLKVPDLSCLVPAFARRDLQKIFHGADYDIRSLHRDFGIAVHNLFDTQIASRFSGIRETGLESVVQHYLNVSLDKKYQRKDWSQRPLSPEMLEYASGDTAWLIPLARILEKNLKKMNRLEWVREECELLSRVRTNEENGAPLFLKFKGAGQFRPRNLAILEKILQVRREFAEKKDRPAFKIFGNNAVTEIVNARPLSIRQLEKIGTLSQKQIGMYGESLIRAVKDALALRSEDLPVFPRKSTQVLSPGVPDRIKKLREWRNRRAEELGMDPALICNKSLMTTIAMQKPRHTDALKNMEEIRQWQIAAFGEEIVRVLNGK
ncbi:MAG: HRDC domain-containing protein [Desulfobacterales bacterium]